MKTKAKKTMKKIKNEDTYLQAKITTDKCKNMKTFIKINNSKLMKVQYCMLSLTNK